MGRDMGKGPAGNGGAFFMAADQGKMTMGVPSGTMA